MGVQDFRPNGHDKDTCGMCAVRREDAERWQPRTAANANGAPGCERDVDMSEEMEQSEDNEARLRQTCKAFRCSLGMDVDRFVEERQARADEDDTDMDADEDAKAGAACSWPCDRV